MDAADLKVFEAVARLGGMGRAAEALHTVQSNVTARIRRLEEELGTPLFHRHARGAEPTAAGHRLLPYARRVQRLLDDARHAALDDGVPQGSLVVGSLDTTAALHLTPILAAFATAHPAVDLTLRTGTTRELLEAVLSDQVEGAFVCGPLSHPELVAEPTFVEELVMLTAPSVRCFDDLWARGEVRVVVLRAGCSYRLRLEGFLARQGIPAPRVLEFGTLETVVGCVAAGLGVTLLPRALVGPVWLEGRVSMHRLPPEEARVETVFAQRKDGYRSSALEAFIAATRTPSTFQAAAE